MHFDVQSIHLETDSFKSKTPKLSQIVLYLFPGRVNNRGKIRVERIRFPHPILNSCDGYNCGC